MDTSITQNKAFGLLKLLRLNCEPAAFSYRGSKQDADGEEFSRKNNRLELGLQILDENCCDLLPDPRRVYKSVVFTRV